MFLSSFPLSRTVGDQLRDYDRKVFTLRNNVQYEDTNINYYLILHYLFV